MASPSVFFFFSFVPFAHVCTFRFDLDLNVTVLPQMIQLTEQDSINTFIFYLLEFRFHFLCTKWEELVDCVCVHVCVCVCACDSNCIIIWNSGSPVISQFKMTAEFHSAWT